MSDCNRTYESLIKIREIQNEKMLTRTPPPGLRHRQIKANRHGMSEFVVTAISPESVLDHAQALGIDINGESDSEDELFEWDSDAEDLHEVGIDSPSQIRVLADSDEENVEGDQQSLRTSVEDEWMMTVTPPRLQRYPLSLSLSLSDPSQRTNHSPSSYLGSEHRQGDEPRASNRPRRGRKQNESRPR